MRSTQRIALLLALVFFIPVVFFSIYQLSSLDEDERLMEDIYNKQLEAILFSVNQYSDDVISQWVARIEAGLYTYESDSIPPKINELLNLNASLMALMITDTTLATSSSWFQQEGLPNNEPIRVGVANEIVKNSEKINTLLKYKKKGFQKIEQLADLETSNNNKLKLLVFISEEGNRFKAIVMVIDPQLFIDDIIGPRLQTMAREQFVLTTVHKPEDSIVYSTSVRMDSLNSMQAVTKDFWIFPEYALGIFSVGNGIETIIAERTRFNITLLTGLIVVLIIALILVFRNLKKEVDLAQNKADFVSNVSHEIRTPLALISMFAETLEMNRVQSEEKKQEYYRILSKEAQRLTRIVNKILNFSQAEAKKKQLRIERLNMKPEIESVLSIYDYHLKSKGFTYTFECPETLWLLADREALIESFINLVENSIKYSDERKHIAIKCGKQDGSAFLSVEDHGVGISEVDQRYIFDKFYRVPKGDLARAKGTGLGLALVKQLVEEQKGKVSVQSVPGKGSTFTLYYPLD